MTDNQDLYKQRCLHLIEEKLGWGASNTWSNQDFQRLSNQLYEKTNVLLSVSTLKRVWGKVTYDSKPSSSTLDALAQYLDYANWQSFIAGNSTPQEYEPVTKSKSGRHSSLYKSLFLWIVAIGCFSFIAAFIYMQRAEKKDAYSLSSLSASDFSLSSKPVTKGIPNTVIFTYDASKSPTDSVFIQQSWDSKRRQQVSKDGHTHTSVYYEPGYYQAKLVIGNQVVQEYPLVVPTDGWLGTIDHSPTPIYLKVEDFVKEDQLNASGAVLRKYNLNPLAEQISVKYYQVGGFEPVPVNKFTFSAEIKNNYDEGINACQLAGIGLLTERMPISFPLSAQGCVSELTITSVDEAFSGKNVDFSKLGANLSDWVPVQCVGDGKSIKYYVNNELAYEAPLISTDLSIIGMVYGFAGGGSVRNIRLNTESKTIFEQF